MGYEPVTELNKMKFITNKLTHALLIVISNDDERPWVT